MTKRTFALLCLLTFTAVGVHALDELCGNLNCRLCYP